MIVMRRMDELIHFPVGKDEIAAAHVCACNPRKLKHYPADWLVVLFKNPANLLNPKKGARELCLYTPFPSYRPNGPDADNQQQSTTPLST